MAKVSAARRKRLAKEKARNTGTNFFDMKNLKKARLRQMPLGEDEDVAFKVGLHFLGRGSSVCPNVTYGNPCPICSARWELSNIDDDEAEELAKKLRVTIRYAMKVVDRADETVVQPIELPTTAYKELFKVYDEDGEDISDPEEGCDFRLSKSGSGLDTEYSVRILQPSPLSKKASVMEDLIKQAEAIDFESIYSQADEKELRDYVESVVPEDFLADILGEASDERDDVDDEEDDDVDDEDEDEDEDADEDDDEDDDGDEDEDEDYDEDDEDVDEDADDDDDEDDDDPDDEDEDEEEEDEDEPAPRRRASKKKAASKKTSKKVTGKKTTKKSTSKKTTKKSGGKRKASDESKDVSAAINKGRSGRSTKRRMVRR